MTLVFKHWQGLTHMGRHSIKFWGPTKDCSHPREEYLHAFSEKVGRVSCAQFRTLHVRMPTSSPFSAAGTHSAESISLAWSRFLFL